MKHVQTHRSRMASYCRPFRSVFFWSVLFLAAASGATQAAEEVFIGEFLLKEDQWPRWEQEQRVLTVEGRTRALTRLHLTMQQCDLIFRPVGGIEFNRQQEDSSIVRLSGKLTRETGEEGELYFAVDRFEHLPSLEKELKKLRNLKNEGAVEPLYELARRFEQYGDFYEDDELLRQADELYVEGLRIESKRLHEDDHGGMLSLADRAGSRVDSNRFELELRHQAFRTLWKNLRRTGYQEEQVEPLLDQILEQLPAAGAPLTDEPGEIAAQYAETPLEVYSQADEFTRLTLHRLFFLDVVREYLARRVAPNESNAMEVAERMETLAPEAEEAIREMRLRGLKFKREHITQLTRSEMLDIRNYFLEYGEEEQANSAVREWLTHREARAVEEGPANIPFLARDRAELLNDTNGAIDLLLRTIRTHPDAEAVKQELDSRGYAFIEGSWRNRREWEAQHPDETEEEVMRDGMVVAGMTFDQVERTMGYPVSRTRSVSALTVSEIWNYPQSQTTKILVYFRWARGENRSTATVEKVAQP